MLNFFQSNAPAPAPDVEMGIEIEQPYGNKIESSTHLALPQNNEETETASVIIEKQKKTIEMCMAQVSHQLHFDEDVT